MIGYIKGEAVDFGEGYVVVENNGIGYEIFVSNTTNVKIRNGS